ncbi:RDD family protein [Gaopeijia maritima]|uniref:RDD family protein n=1 Tax=Gaopeijia maritima TaxID=3119007 RepID=A0ABU9E4T8_9BACT
MATNVRDPRSIITPDAFEISKDLLGTPLGAPSRRLWAMLIDLMVIGFLTVATASISLILWGAVAVFFITMAFRSPGRSFGQVASILFRGATGCLGTVILIGVLIGYVASNAGDDFIDDFAKELAEPSSGEALDVPDVAGVEGPRELTPPDLGGILRGISAFAGATGADDPDEAAEVLGRSLSELGASQLQPAEARSLLDELVGDEVAWAAERDSVYAQAFRIAGVGDDADESSADAEALRLAGELAALSDAEASARWFDLRARIEETEEPDEADETRLALLTARLAPIIAADSLDSLGDQLDELGDDLESTESRLAEARAEIEAGEAGFLGLARDIWEQAGSAIGLWSIYFTVALTVTGGRTVGKKLMGLRVLRLDGQPLNWWSSFERAGGYVAGVATGTLGFVQVFWDPNRQCVHDKIVGTVVVADGAEIEPGAWQEAWAVQQERRPSPVPTSASDEPREDARVHAENPRRATGRADRDDGPRPSQPPPA